MLTLLQNLFYHRSKRIQTEIWRRARVSIWAYAYEELNESLVSDDVFDAEALLIDPSIRTGNDMLDDFFATQFAPYTGSWIGEHPDLKRVQQLCKSIIKQKRKGNKNG